MAASRFRKRKREAPCRATGDRYRTAPAPRRQIGPKKRGDGFRFPAVVCPGEHGPHKAGRYVRLAAKACAAPPVRFLFGYVQCQARPLHSLQRRKHRHFLCLLMGNDNRLDVYLSCCYIGHHHGDGLMKTPGAAGTRVQPQYPVFFFHREFVGMTEYHHVYAR